jgi:hypothetical protein
MVATIGFIPKYMAKRMLKNTPRLIRVVTMDCAVLLLPNKKISIINTKDNIYIIFFLTPAKI